MSEKRKSLAWASRQAVAILAVDNIKLPVFGYELLRRKEEGFITHEQAREELRALGHALAAQGKQTE
ncbi:hypothetical protein [Burkholderia ubonensis]|uniref:hypothetical protein n=1 Tax=Burkholderia ubonensis TaxID=101571 RepID=UPI0018E11758|nr:hypothetical protein [Burkholderia ubonensis]